MISNLSPEQLPIITTVGHSYLIFTFKNQQIVHYPIQYPIYTCRPLLLLLPSIMLLHTSCLAKGQPLWACHFTQTTLLSCYYEHVTLHKEHCSLALLLQAPSCFSLRCDPSHLLWVLISFLISYDSSNMLNYQCHCYSGVLLAVAVLLHFSTVVFWAYGDATI